MRNIIQKNKIPSHIADCHHYYCAGRLSVANYSLSNPHRVTKMKSRKVKRPLHTDLISSVIRLVGREIDWCDPLTWITVRQATPLSCTASKLPASPGRQLLSNYRNNQTLKWCYHHLPLNATMMRSIRREHWSNNQNGGVWKGHIAVVLFVSCCNTQATNR